jgi:hypothetical protein
MNQTLINMKKVILKSILCHCGHKEEFVDRWYAHDFKDKDKTYDLCDSCFGGADLLEDANNNDQLTFKSEEAQSKIIKCPELNVLGGLALNNIITW